MDSRWIRTRSRLAFALFFGFLEKLKDGQDAKSDKDDAKDHDAPLRCSWTKRL